MNAYRWIVWALFLFCLVPLAHAADAPAQQGESVQVMEDFQKQKTQQMDSNKLTEQSKRRIMFYLGVPLLILLLITAGLGVSMAVFGKQTFMAHMVFAGLTLTLSIAHVIVGLVWFYPF